MEAIVAGECDETAPGCRQGEEDLDGRILPYARFLQLRPVSLAYVVSDAFVVPVQEEAPH